ncbi:MAG: hypothetical protein E6Q62_04805 [Nitrosomonas sp.]|nr:MAG: hypothetical protein E6Q62_04805 [Nitrosomonas sp.]
MHAVQRQLHTDHYHLQRLLNCLSHEIDCYDYDSHENADLTVILSALDYVHDYPDKWHHPAEDVIFCKLQQKDVKECPLIEQLKSEHREILQATRTIYELFNMAAEDCIVPAYQLLETTRHYIALQRQHIHKENEYIYPLMNKVFTDQEWDAIENAVKIRNDPLFTRQSKKEYEMLYHYIFDLEAHKNH